jgi:hypothetical protein
MLTAKRIALLLRGPAEAGAKPAWEHTSRRPKR